MRACIRLRMRIFDVGGTEIKYSVMDETLVGRDGGSVPTPMTDQEDFIETLYALYAPHKDEVEGIAMGGDRYEPSGLY